MGAVRAKIRAEKSPQMEGKVISTIGFIVHLLLVAIPLDIWTWLRGRRKDVTNQTVVITGGGSGIGQRMAEMFALELGANVAILDVDLSKAEAAAAQIQSRNGRALAFHCDVTNPKAMEDCAETIKAAFGRVDIVICNAAILYIAHTLELSADQIQRAMNVNIVGVLNTIRAFLRDFEAENRGHIVAVSSIAGYYGETYGMAYCPGKFAVRGIMECLQMELGDRGLHGIKCTTLCPYFVRTPMILGLGMRPTSRFIPFMSINRCCRRAVDAILREKTLCFIPGYIYIMAFIKNLMTENVRIAARNWLNCRYVPVATPNVVAATSAVDAATPIIAAADEKPVANSPLSTLSSSTSAGSIRTPEMANYFRWAHWIWWLVMPLALGFTFVVYLHPQRIPVKYLSFFGEFAYKLGTEHNHIVGWICIFAVLAHFAEAVFALHMCNSLGFSHACALKWFLQTLVLGFPSTTILYKYRNSKHKQKA